MSNKPSTLFLTLITLFLSLYNNAQAHEIRPAIVNITLEDEQYYRINIQLNVEALIAQINPQHQDTNEAENTNYYDTLRLLSSKNLARKFKLFENTLLQDISLQANDETLTLKVVELKIPDIGDTDLARNSSIILAGQLPPNTQNIKWHWNKKFGANVVRVNSPNNPDLYTTYLQNGKSSNTIVIANNSTKSQSIFEIFSNYLTIGFQHILPKGLDHILFVIGLFLLSIKMRPLLLQITSFTLAHSITLALGMMGVIQIPANIVEPLIAASIVYVCIENIYSDKLNIWRPFIVFCFGLLHGLGFSSVLAEIGLSPQHFVTGLIAFNVGIELGQITIIGLCFLAIGLWFRHKPWYRSRISVPASAVIAIIGTYWFIERTVLA
ncbi:MAG TPA: HupE/UreJ family protein [Leucothrix mucor]|nr:HupE/UreJ family protein [Leucothrix mucor]